MYNVAEQPITCKTSFTRSRENNAMLLSQYCKCNSKQASKQQTIASERWIRNHLPDREKAEVVR